MGLRQSALAGVAVTANLTPTCRFCAAPLTQTLVDLGATPLANSYVAEADLGQKEARYPLHARVCNACFLVQVDDAVPAAEIFSDYAYFSSYSDSWVAHARAYAEMATARLGLGLASQVVEIASNDGYLLQHFVARGIPSLGVEPAANVAAVAREKGIPTEIAFFGRETAARLKESGKAADLIIANNVMAHVPDLRDFIAGVAHLLKYNGVFTAEFPHLLNLIEETQFDTIYHEHYSYLSLLAVERILAAHELALFDVEEIPTHGGSLRIFAEHRGAGHKPGPGLQRVRNKESQANFDTSAGYEGFEPKVRAIRAGLLSFLDAAHAAGKRVVAYGAAAKGNTLLNYCGVTTDRIDFVVDRNPAKQGRYLPGSLLPVHAEAAIKQARPDYVLILPWNLRQEIAAQLAYIGSWGGRCVVPVPELEIFDV